jgi:aminobenzoyl-glutamate transport protein
MAKKKEQKFVGPVFTIALLAFIIALLSLILSLFKVDGSQTVIAINVLESYSVTVRSFFTRTGLINLFDNTTTVFRPIMLVLISLMGMSIAEASGLFKYAFKNASKLSPTLVTFITILLATVASIFGEFAFVVIIPLAAIFYKYANRNSRLGVLTAFLGASMGYGTTLLASNITLKLGELTQASASLNVDKSYIYNANSTLFISIISTILFAVLATVIIERKLSKLYNKKTPLQDENMTVSRRAYRIANVFGILYLLVLAYSITSGLPFSGILLGEGANYQEKLMGSGAPFKENVVLLFTVYLMIRSLIYGYISKNISDTLDFSKSLSKYNIYPLVLMYFALLLLSIVDFTRIGTVISLKLVTFLESVQFSGSLLIFAFMIIVLIISILIPDTLTKWQLLSPTIIPLFMRSNISPEFTQFIFEVFDGIGKSLSVFFPYFMLMIALLETYNYDNDNKITIFGTLWKILPTILEIIVGWVLIILAWHVIGLPLGIGTITTL